MARDLPCKASDKAECGEAQARVAQQSRSDAPELLVRRSALLNEDVSCNMQASFVEQVLISPHTYLK
ncbi:hypothetical protein EHR06_10985 [Leptospira dzoumogneensis]|uniref:Uncharacterized protein n=1 Tax=Leptospira dzoumogneensis TaxID=2484904 RepID=A0A4Z1ACP6_9LEPT|nr:hypothetical protein EHR06_10985 [Leptospira dzoumogneensis]